MRHFLVYHSENVVGPVEGHEPKAYTKKNLGIEKGDRIWVVLGESPVNNKGRTRYSLWKTFVVDQVKVDHSEEFPNRYYGNIAERIDADLIGLQWFDDFKRYVLRPAHYSSQQLTDSTIIDEFNTLLTAAH